MDNINLQILQFFFDKIQNQKHAAAFRTLTFHCFEDVITDEEYKALSNRLGFETITDFSHYLVETMIKWEHFTQAFPFYIVSKQQRDYVCDLMCYMLSSNKSYNDIKQKIHEILGSSDSETIIKMKEINEKIYMTYYHDFKNVLDYQKYFSNEKP